MHEALVADLAHRALTRDHLVTSLGSSIHGGHPSVLGDEGKSRKNQSSNHRPDELARGDEHDQDPRGRNEP